MERCFYSQEKNSNKFWNVKVEKNRLIVRFGKTGTSGRENIKEYPDNAAALKEAEKLIGQKIKKGYIETEKGGEIPDKPDLANMPMDEELFWKVIDMFNWKKEGDDDEVMKPAIKFLTSRTVEDIFAFHDIMAKKLYDLDGEKWGKIVEDACDGYLSADLFLYVRCCIVANGKDVNEEILGNPSALNPDLDFESLLYLPDEAWAKKTKNDSMDYPHKTEYDFESFKNMAQWSLTE